MSLIDVFSICFLTICSIQCLFYGAFFFSFLKIPKTKKIAHTHTSVSVIICAKNEAHNLQLHLPHILEQDYFNFEVVLVNDNSTDDTLKVMQSFKEKHSNITIVNINGSSNKKRALTKGIEAAKNEYILLTDADCKPLSKHWIKSMSAHFSSKKDIVLGYGGYTRYKWSLLNDLIRYETVFTALQYFSFAKLGHPYMGVGRNLGYKKSVFTKNGGFQNHQHILSGDDDLFINQVATKNNIALCTDTDSFTISKPKTSFSDWFKQKRRHITTANHYTKTHKNILGLFYLSQLSFFLCIWSFFLVGLEFNLIIATGIIARYLFQLLALHGACKRFNEKHLLVEVPILEPFLVLTQLAIFTANLIRKPSHWK